MKIARMVSLHSCQVKKKNVNIFHSQTSDTFSFIRSVLFSFMFIHSKHCSFFKYIQQQDKRQKKEQTSIISWLPVTLSSASRGKPQRSDFEIVPKRMVDIIYKHIIHCNRSHTLSASHSKYGYITQFSHAIAVVHSIHIGTLRSFIAHG